MPLSPLAVFHAAAAATSADVRPNRSNHQQNVPAAAAHLHVALPAASGHPSSPSVASSQSVGSIHARMHSLGVGAAAAHSHAQGERTPEQRMAELQGCTAQVQQFLEHYYQQLEADLNGFAGLRITTPTGAALLQGDSGTAAPAGATNGHPAHSTARSLAEVLNLKQHQASAIPPPKPLRDYTAEIDGTPSSVRVQSNGSVSSAFDVMHVSSASAPGVKLEEGAESEEEQQGDEEGDAEEADEEEEEDVDSRSSEEDDEDYSESSRKSKQQNKKKGVLTSMFSSRQSKSGRAVKRRTKEDEEQEDEDDEFGDDEEASEGGGRGARNRRSNRSDSPKARRSKLPLHTTNTLRGWALAHVHHPFPVDAEKKELATMCKLNFKQVSDWFTNNRKRFWKPFSDHLASLKCVLAVDHHSVCQCDEPEEPSEKGKKQKDAPVPTAAAAAAVKSTSRVRRDASGAAGPSSAKQEKLRTAASVSWDLIKAKYEWQEEYSRAVSTGREKPPPLRLPTEVNSLEDEFKRQNGRMPTHMWVQMWD